MAGVAGYRFKAGGGRLGCAGGGRVGHGDGLVG